MASNKFTLESAIFGVTRALNDGLSKLEQVNREIGNGVYTPQYSEARTLEAKATIGKNVAAKLQEYIDTYTEVEKDLNTKAAEERQAYKPIGAQDEILFLLKKQDLKEFYLSLDDTKLTEAYQKEGDPVRLAIIEALILEWSDRTREPNWPLKSIVTQAQESRIRQATSEGLAFLESKKGLLDFAKRSLGEIRGNPDAIQQFVFLWTNLAQDRPPTNKEKEALNARLIKLFGLPKTEE